MSSRRARWIRGDWQILQWLLPWVPRADRGFQRNLLPSLSRWKIADNLRRSVVPAALVALLVVRLVVGAAGGGLDAWRYWGSWCCPRR